MKIITRAPGKLFIAGEYAVVEGKPAIISSVSKYLTITLRTTSKTSVISSKNPNNTITFNRINNKLQLTSRNYYPIISKTLQITEENLRHYGYHTNKNYTLTITSDLDDESGKKYGLGSSGAISIAIIKALYRLYNKRYSSFELYKIAVLVQLSLKNNGSCGDIAASSFNSLIYYRKFDTMWLLKQMKFKSYAQIIQMRWKNLIIQRLTLPKNCSFLVGWSGNIASSYRLVQNVSQIKKSYHYKQFLMQSETTVNHLKEAFETEDHQKIAKYLRYNRFLLTNLSSLIETETLTTLCNIGEKYDAPSKTSGAGGGDCGICFIKDKQVIPLIELEWEKNNIKSLGELICQSNRYMKREKMITSHMH